MYVYDGHCPCCEQDVTFSTNDGWYRDHLLCPICQSVVRERALALVLTEVLPQWKTLRIHESSPADRGISKKLKSNAPRYLATHFFPDLERGEFVGTFRNEDLENQTFFDNTFDLVISLDVTEHVFDPEKVYKEIFRTLCPGGYYIHTFPIMKHQVNPVIRRAERSKDNTVNFLISPEYHGNPISDAGSLVVCDFGYEISQKISEWSCFDVRIIRFWDQYHGIIGEFTDVIICRKPGAFLNDRTKTPRPISGDRKS